MFWPDVADAAASASAVIRHYEAEEKRRIRAQQLEELAAAVAAGEDPDVAGERLGIHPARVRLLLYENEHATAS